jgi:sulfate/thiosulfate transport system permease protein
MDNTLTAAIVRISLIAFAIAAVAILIGGPAAFVFVGALRHGGARYARAITDPSTMAAVRLTCIVLVYAIPVNVIFGVAAAWAIARFEFVGRDLLVSLIDLPFAVSPVISGLVFVLLFGARAPVGHWLGAHHIQIVFATPGIILATVFVTFPLVARELIPVFASLDVAVDEAALVSGATGWQLLTRVTLPQSRAALVSGVALALARAAGEFGAVAVVSGHIAGRTNTLSLEIASRYDSGDSTAAFAIATLLLALAVSTLAIRQLADR